MAGREADRLLQRLHQKPSEKGCVMSAISEQAFDLRYWVLTTWGWMPKWRFPDAFPDYRKDDHD